MKIRPVAAKLFHGDGRRDRHEAKRRFSQFCEERLKIEPLPQSKRTVFPMNKSIVKAIYKKKNGCCSNNNSVEIKTVWLKLEISRLSWGNEGLTSRILALKKTTHSSFRSKYAFKILENRPF